MHEHHPTIVSRSMCGVMRRHLSVAAMLSVLSAGVANAQGASCPRIAPPRVTPPPQCTENCEGEERWSLKTLVDRDVRTIDWTPRPTTISDVGSFRRPQRILDDRRAGVYERRVYCIEAWIVEVRPQGDGDLHVNLVDPDDGSEMIVEIPDSKCQNVCRSPWTAVFSAARERLETRLRTWDTDTLRVVVSGVGFFDRNHGQLGAAPNSFELHPVLSVRFPKPARARRR